MPPDLEAPTARARCTRCGASALTKKKAHGSSGLDRLRGTRCKGAARSQKPAKVDPKVAHVGLQTEPTGPSRTPKAPSPAALDMGHVLSGSGKQMCSGLTTDRFFGSESGRFWLRLQAGEPRGLLECSRRVSESHSGLPGPSTSRFSTPHRPPASSPNLPFRAFPSSRPVYV